MDFRNWESCGSILKPYCGRFLGLDWRPEAPDLNSVLKCSPFYCPWHQLPKPEAQEIGDTALFTRRPGFWNVCHTSWHCLLMAREWHCTPLFPSVPEEEGGFALHFFFFSLGVFTTEAKKRAPDCPLSVGTNGEVWLIQRLHTVKCQAQCCLHVQTHPFFSAPKGDPEAWECTVLGCSLCCSLRLEDARLFKPWNMW